MDTQFTVISAEINRISAPQLAELGDLITKYQNMLKKIE